jgi:hypothetical protein
VKGLTTMASPGTAAIGALGSDPHDDVVHPSSILFVADGFRALTITVGAGDPKIAGRGLPWIA